MESEMHKYALLLGASILVMATSAKAEINLETLPASIRGDWCPLTGGRWGRVEDEQTKCPDESILKIDSTRFDEWEVGCNIHKIKEVSKDKSYVLGMKCGSEGSVWYSTTSLQVLRNSTGTVSIEVKMIKKSKDFVEK